MTSLITSNIIDILNNYYAVNDIYKSFIICNTDEDVNNLALLMEKELYTVCKITSSDLLDDYDERNLNKVNNESYNKITEFNTTSYRVLIISYDLWEKLKEELEVYILPEQNLIVLNLLNTVYINNIYDWINDTLTRGFINRTSSYLMTINDDSTFIDTLVDSKSCKNYNLLCKYGSYEVY